MQQPVHWDILNKTARSWNVTILTYQKNAPPQALNFSNTAS